MKTGMYCNNDSSFSIIVYQLDPSEEVFDIEVLEDEEEWMGSFSKDEINNLINENNLVWKRELTKEELNY